MKSKKDSTNNKETKKVKWSYYMAMGMSLGVLFGTAISAVSNADISICDSFGLGIGAFLGAIYGKCKS